MAKWSAASRRFFAHVNFDLYRGMEKWGNRVIGFDLSATSTGYAILDIEDGSFVECNTIEFSRADGTDSERYYHFYNEFYELLKENNCHFLAFEAVRVKKQTGSFQMLSQVLSALQIAREDFDMETYSISLSPNSIKKCSGAGYDASKEDVVNSIVDIYDIDRDINDDQADAISCARAAYHMHKMQPCYSSLFDFIVNDDEDKIYDFLLDLFKRRIDLFESSVEDLDNDCIDSVLGCISGKSGLHCLKRNDINRYYSAMEKANEIYG